LTSTKSFRVPEIAQRQCPHPLLLRSTKSADIYFVTESQRATEIWMRPDIAYRHIIKGDVSDVVVRAALPGVVQAETKSACVASVKSNEFAECAVLDVDRPVVDLHSANREVTAGQRGDDITELVCTHQITPMMGHLVNVMQWTKKKHLQNQPEFNFRRN